jgi:hypothetical protein
MTRDHIDELLDGDAPLPDDGFTRRVMAALPPPRPARGLRLALWLPGLAAALAAAALAPELARLGPALLDGSAGLGAALAAALAPLLGPWTVQVAALATGLALAAAALGSWLVAEPT